MSQCDELRPNDFQRMCKQAERDQESKKLVELMERVQRQLEERRGDRVNAVHSPKPPVAAITRTQPMTSRTSFFER